MSFGPDKLEFGHQPGLINKYWSIVLIIGNKTLKSLDFESIPGFRFLSRPEKIILTSFKAHVLNKNEEKLAKLYQTVSRATLIEVYKKYKYDYELFGFDFNKVLKLAGYHTLTKHEETLEPGFYKTKNFEGYSS